MQDRISVAARRILVTATFCVTLAVAVAVPDLRERLKAAASYDDLNIFALAIDELAWANGREKARIVVFANDVLTGDLVENVPITLSALSSAQANIEPKVAVTNQRIEDVFPVAVFEVSSEQVGSVEFTATATANRAAPSSDTVSFITKTAHIFVQGINTSLYKTKISTNVGAPPFLLTRSSTGTDRDVFPNLRNALLTMNQDRLTRDTAENEIDCGNGFDDDSDGVTDDGCPLVLNYSYNGGHVDSNGFWLPKKYIEKDTKQDLNQSINNLNNLIAQFSIANPNTEFCIYGHSQGGLIAFQTLSAESYTWRGLQTNGVAADANLECVVTLDAILGGTPSVRTTLTRLGPWGKPAAEQVIRLFNSTSEDDRVRQGTAARFLLNSNEAIVTFARDLDGTRVLTLGSNDDCVFDAKKCARTAKAIDQIDATSSQIVENADEFELYDLGLDCFGRIPSQTKRCISSSHNAILFNDDIIERVAKFGSIH